MIKKNNKINLIIAFILTLLVIVPYLIMFISSFSTSAAIKGNQIFKNLSFLNFFNNFQNLKKESYFIDSLLNSFFITTIATVLSVFISSLAGYAYSILKSKNTERLFVYTFLTIMVPLVSIIVPIFLIFKYISLLDNYFGVIIASISLPFNIYLFKQNGRLMPMELIKAARIDGLSEFEIFTKVFFPCMRPVFITSILLTFVEIWNSLLIPLVLIQTQSKFTNSIFLNSLGSIWSCDYAVLMMVLLFSTLPLLILFIWTQKYFKSAIGGIN